MNTTNRRGFVKATAAAAAGTMAAATADNLAPAEQTYMGGFAAPKLAKVKIAFIGCGKRSNTHIPQLSTLEGTEVVAVSDLYQDLAERAQKRITQIGKGERHKNVKTYHGDKFAYKKMLAEVKPDLVYVITPWEWHAPMAIDAMNAGAHVCVEVPLCLTLEDSWDLVNTSEKTKRHCMMLENVNYGRDELLYLNMCRKGIFGELLHGEASYIHDLRKHMHHVEKGRGTGSWRTFHWAENNGNLYPTHGLGPVAQYMNIGRGEDMFRRLVSFSTPARNRALYVKNKMAADNKLNNVEFKGGDMSTSIIKTTLGRTIMVQWDESSPRPYSRHNLIQGTKGTGAGFPTRIALDYAKGTGLPNAVMAAMGTKKGHTNFHRWAQGAQLKAVYEAYDHPLYKRLKPIADKLGGHGGMDAIMNFRVIECLINGLPLDQNVYEGCLWSSVTPLSMKSVELDGMPQDFPDFTRGQWKTTKPLGIVQ